MGYEQKPKLYQLRFEDHPDFKVTMRGLSVDGFTALMRHASSLIGVDLAKVRDDPQRMAGALDAMDALFSRFAARLVGWNLEEDGQPVPADRDGVGSQDLAFILEITMAWMDAIASVDTPLPPPANGHASSREASIPMEILSPSPRS
jgi:hypothetical protein